MTDYERTEMIAEARVFALASPVLLPILEKRKKEAMGRLMQAHKAGRTDTAAIVAELSAFIDIENEIRQKETMYNTLEEQQYVAGKNRK